MRPLHLALDVRRGSLAVHPSTRTASFSRERSATRPSSSPFSHTEPQHYLLLPTSYFLLPTSYFLLPTGPLTYDVFGLLAARNATYGYVDVNVETPEVASGLADSVAAFLKRKPLMKPTMLSRFMSGGRWDGSKFYTNFQVPLGAPTLTD